MVKIVSDTSTLYSPKEAKDLGLHVAPLHCTVNDKSYKEFVDITSDELIEMINKGALPTSSQPAIGDKVDIYNELTKDNEVIDITMADGLSGTYHSAEVAKDNADDSDKITVVNSKTLCGPHRLLVDEALKMAKENKSKEEILNMLNKSIETDISFLIPFDFEFLRRGGRISKAEASLGSLLKLIVCMKKSDDGKCLEKFSISRTYKGLINKVIDYLKEKGVDSTYRFYVTHAQNMDLAKKVKAAIEETFKGIVEIYDLSPVFVVQGGPKCCAIQTIKIVK